MVNALLLIGVALIIGSFLLSHTPPPMQRQLVRIERDARKRRN
jgi:hypothetical protein